MFKKVLWIVSLSVVCFGMDYQLKPVQISPSVWQFVGKTQAVSKENGGNIANTYWIKTAKHWVVVDSGATYEYASQAHSIMQKVAPLKVKMVLNTHKHDDHWMGNSYYKAKNIPIYATKLQHDSFHEGDSSRILRTLNKKDLKGTKVVTIDNVLEKSFKMQVDSTTIEFIKIQNPAHTTNDFIFHLPKESVLFTGDILMSERLISIRHGSIEGSLKTIKMIKKMNPKVYANGHGKHTDSTAVKLTQSYLQDLKVNALRAIEDDIGLDEFAKKTPFPKYKDYALYKVAHRENLSSAYKEYEFFEDE